MKVYLEGGPLNGVESESSAPLAGIAVSTGSGVFSAQPGEYQPTGRTRAGLTVYEWIPSSATTETA